MWITTNPMIKEIKNQNISHKAFTLIEMIIVLIIIGILLLATLYLSWEQIQKVRNKTVKEAILSEWQSRYSSNLSSSYFGSIWYKDMNVGLEKWKNDINFEYMDREHENEKLENTFVDNFSIKYIKADNDVKDNINLTYQPYQIKCKIWENYDSVKLVININDNKDYCFEINNKNCRLIELSEFNCNTFRLANHIGD